MPFPTIPDFVKAGEKGSALTVSEFDGNWADLEEFLDQLRTDGGFTGRGIDSIAIVGDQLTFTLDDATEFTVTVPMALPNPTGNWAGATNYAVLDLVVSTDSGGGTIGNGYICIVAHTSTTFAADLAANKWVKYVDRGAPGAPGADGEDGADGLDGATWYSDTGAPGSGLGVDNDFYFREDTSDVYKKTSGTWGIIANLEGATGMNGLDGATIHVDSGAPSDMLGADGDLYLDTANGDLYLKTAGTWGSPAANFTGPPGVGSEWIVDSGPPGDGIGAEGDVYLDAYTSDVYQRESGSPAWVLKHNIQGNPGAPGDPGPVNIFQGAGAPDNGDGTDGDLYIDNATGDVYRKVSGDWGAPFINIIGPQGYAQGRRGIPLPGYAFVAMPTEGSSYGISETSTNKVPLAGFNFDPTTDETSFVCIPMPPSWDEGSIYVVLDWITAAASGDAVFQVSALCLGDGDTLDTPFGTAVSMTDTVTGAGQLMKTAEIGPITPGGSPAAGDLMWIKVRRDADNTSGTDSITANDVRIVGGMAFITMTDAED